MSNYVVCLPPAVALHLGLDQSLVGWLSMFALGAFLIAVFGKEEGELD